MRPEVGLCRGSVKLTVIELQMTCCSSASFKIRNRAPSFAAAIFFISRDSGSDSIAKLFRACFCGVSHNYRAMCCKMGYRTDVSV